MNAILAVLTLVLLSFLTIVLLYEGAIYPAAVFAVLTAVVAYGLDSA